MLTDIKVIVRRINHRVYLPEVDKIEFLYIGMYIDFFKFGKICMCFPKCDCMHYFALIRPFRARY